MVTVEDAREYLGAETDEDVPSVVQRMIDAAVLAMEGYAGRHFLDAEVVETVKAANGYSAYLWLSEPPREILSSDPELPGYRIGGSRLVAENGWFWGEYRITFKAGYAAGEVPADLVQACLDQTAAIHARWKADKAGLSTMSSQTVDGWNQTFLERTGLELHVAQTVARYRPGRL